MNAAEGLSAAITVGAAIDQAPAVLQLAGLLAAAWVARRILAALCRALHRAATQDGPRPAIIAAAQAQADADAIEIADLNELYHAPAATNRNIRTEDR